MPASRNRLVRPIYGSNGPIPKDDGTWAWAFAHADREVFGRGLS